MVRSMSNLRQSIACYPLARGDGPDIGKTHTQKVQFSPRPWGWSGHDPSETGGGNVFPARVGMVRPEYATGSILIRFPRARGDGPTHRKNFSEGGRFSPRPWGWSAWSMLNTTNRRVIPAPVGMVRFFRFRRGSVDSFPLARGDGRKPEKPPNWRKTLSPRAWGWSVLLLSCLLVIFVIPSPMGMVRTPVVFPRRWGSYPRARGDGPRGWLESSAHVPFSPRPWGWSVRHILVGRGNSVFPAPVGMVRKLRLTTFSPTCFPRARGDGPKQMERRKQKM